MYTFGRNANFKTGQGTNSGDTIVPTIVDDAGRSFDKISAGTQSTVFLLEGEMFGFGANLQLGVNNATGDTQTTTKLNNFSDWDEVSIGNWGAAIRGGLLYTWGSNADGRTGQGTTVGNTLVPTQIAAFNNWSTVSAGTSYGLAIRNGELYAWGSNFQGATGLGTTSGSQNTPLRIGTDSNWEAVAAGNNTSYALKNGGELWGWGEAITTSTSTTTTPLRIGTLDGWDSVSAAFGNGMLIRDGDLYGVGVNGTQGRLGLPTSINYTATPLQVGDSGGWQLASAGQFYSLAVRRGVLFSAGSNANGKTGQGTTVGDTIGMTAVEGMQRVIKIDASSEHSVVEVG
jgi:alpha-tubulin suppressor-like RCC1 family protein